MHTNRGTRTACETANPLEKPRKIDEGTTYRCSFGSPEGYSKAQKNESTGAVSEGLDRPCGIGCSDPRDLIPKRRTAPDNLARMLNDRYVSRGAKGSFNGMG